MELEDKNMVSQVPLSTLETEDPAGYSNDEIDQLLETIISEPPTVRNEPRLSLSPIPQLNIIQTRLPSPTIITQPISTTSPEITECGWASPPRTVVLDHYPPIHLSTKSNSLMNIHFNSNSQSRAIETDIKPMQNLTNNILQFVENYQHELKQIQNEYRSKFLLDQNLIDKEINQLITNERIALSKFKRKKYY